MRAVVDNPDLAALAGRPADRHRPDQLDPRRHAGRVGRRPLRPHRRCARRHQPDVLRPGRLRRGGVRAPAQPPAHVRSARSSSASSRATRRSSFPHSEIWNHLQVGVPGIFLFLVLLALPEAKLTSGRLVGRDVPPVPAAAGHRSCGPSLFVPVGRPRGRGVAGDYILDLEPRPRSTPPSSCRSCCSPATPGRSRSAQYVFFGLGAFAMGKVAGGDSLLGMGAAAAIAVPVGVVIATARPPAPGPLPRAGHVRARPRCRATSSSRTPGSTGRAACSIGRLELFGLSFESNTAFGVLCGIVFALVGDRRARASAWTVRPPAGRHARQPGRLRHARARRAPHQARRVRPRRRRSPVWPGRSTAAWASPPASSTSSRSTTSCSSSSPSSAASPRSPAPSRWRAALRGPAARAVRSAPSWPASCSL